MKIFPSEIGRKNSFRKIYRKISCPSRLKIFERIFKDNLKMSLDFLTQDKFRMAANRLQQQMEYEFYKDNIEEDSERFKKRTYDRTVHPTQIHSLDSDILFNIGNGHNFTE